MLTLLIAAALVSALLASVLVLAACRASGWQSRREE